MQAQNAAWCSIVIAADEAIGRGRVLGILCDNDGEPLLFDTQLTAIRFWMEHKDKFGIDLSQHIRATPQVVREGDPDEILFGMLDTGQRVAIVPKDDFLFYSDSWEHSATYLGQALEKKGDQQSEQLR